MYSNKEVQDFVESLYNNADEELNSTYRQKKESRDELLQAIGMILLGFGIVQIGLSLKSHDAQQRANGFLTFFGGIIIAFSKDILDMIV